MERIITKIGDQEYFTIKSAANYIGIKYASLYQYIFKNIIVPVIVDDKTYLKKEDVENFKTYRELKKIFISKN